jgi:hypothetical protein
LNPGDVSILAGDFLHTTPVAKNGPCFCETNGCAETVDVLAHVYIGDMTAVLRWGGVEFWGGSTYCAFRTDGLVGDVGNIALLGVEAGDIVVDFCLHACCRLGEIVVGRRGEMVSTA